MHSESLYYRRRAEQHRKLAAEARSEAVRLLHLELAALLAARARSGADALH